ncbi:hypothetical protein HCN44_004169 [Aphidius gifuensis]|uniref:RNA-binding protein 48 n=1 Tax=Aphidius gifuensis TaxID=684658 RepID=A0A835CSV2_APHGI|nr:RNA-binding protein 48 [Aphidius gifuensis]KAF7994697.1 hypothetical protein HCN44_004169 [Aphidius gifuensis]
MDMTTNEPTKVVKLEHHVKKEVCKTRPLYRQGKKLTAVKVYTINDESQHIIICGVPKVNLKDDVERISAPYGVIKLIEHLPDYPSEEFTDTFHLRYERIQSARIAKRFLDGKNFFGGILHVFYAPELETIAETRQKLIQRNREVAMRIKRNQQDSINLQTNEFKPKAQYHRQKKYPTLPLTEDRLSKQYPGETFSSINHGIPTPIDPRPVTEPSLPGTSSNCTFPEITKKSESSDVKNYKGRHFHSTPTVKVIRPKLIDTMKLTNPINKQINENKNTNVYQAIKKVDSGINIKILSNIDNTKKRIIIKNPSTTSLIEPINDLQSSIKLAKSSIREAMQQNLNKNKN